MLANERLRFKLRSVNYPVYDVFNVSDLENVRNVIVWLEDRIIRVLPADARLRDVQSVDWTSYLNKYLQVIKCPYNESNSWAMLDWLLSKALLLEYNSTQNAQHKNLSEEANSNLSTEVFINININSNEFKENVLKLAKLLQIPNHPDIRILFKAICLVIEQKLEVNVLNNAIKEYGTSKVDMLKLDDVCLGFSVSDPVVKAAAVALRLLNIDRLRKLQNQANAGIVHVQKLTADPKTDERLGKVGF
ncbi:hypothetical protein MN116_007097 [Schistosoma mekongi]|uniref:RNA transcription, translation and transport factor protein n=1 Tax=Schistosoma mekongi TaxID=38744 RepID=A0AAE2D337_SCHME|nr:hypothetical protein MN116_007097 [Schistosoma mekongi]